MKDTDSLSETSSSIEEIISSSENEYSHKLIVGEEKPWSKGTIHIFWPSAVADESDSSFIAWCREDTKGEIKDPAEVLPLDKEHKYSERFCKTCLENAKNAKNIPEPSFLEYIEERIDAELEAETEGELDISE